MSNLKDNKRHLTDEEFKKLVCDIAVAIAPEIIKKSEEKEGNRDRAIAYFSYDFAEAVRVVLVDRMNAKI